MIAAGSSRAYALRHALLFSASQRLVVVDVASVLRTSNANDRKVAGRSRKVAIAPVNTDNLGAAMIEPIGHRIGAKSSKNRNDDGTGAERADHHGNNFRNARQDDRDTVTFRRRQAAATYWQNARFPKQSRQT